MVFTNQVFDWIIFKIMVAIRQIEVYNNIVKAQYCLLQTVLTDINNVRRHGVTLN
jgi:hypothetical protein